MSAEDDARRGGHSDEAATVPRLRPRHRGRGHNTEAESAQAARGDGLSAGRPVLARSGGLPGTGACAKGMRVCARGAPQGAYAEAGRGLGNTLASKKRASAMWTDSRPGIDALAERRAGFAALGRKGRHGSWRQRGSGGRAMHATLLLERVPDNSSSKGSNCQRCARGKMVGLTSSALRQTVACDAM